MVRRNLNDDDIEAIRSLQTISLDEPILIHQQKQARIRDAACFGEGVIHNPRLKFVREQDNIRQLAFYTYHPKALSYPGGYVIGGKSPLILQTSISHHRRSPKSLSAEKDDRSLSSSHELDPAVEEAFTSEHSKIVF